MGAKLIEGIWGQGGFRVDSICLIGGATEGVSSLNYAECVEVSRITLYIITLSDKRFAACVFFLTNFHIQGKFSLIYIG